MRCSYININKKFGHGLKVAMLVLLFNLVSVAVFADDPGLPGGTDADVPLDGGLTLLIAAGVGYGAKKLKDRKRHTKS